MPVSHSPARAGDRATVSRRDVIGGAVTAPFVAAGIAGPTPAHATAGSARLFFTPAAIVAAKRLLQQGHLSLAWTNLRAVADAAVASGAAPFRNTKDPTRAWQRHVAWSMANLAGAFLIGGNTAYRDTATELASLAAAYPVWGLDTLPGGDLAAGDLLFGIAMVVDWLGDDMAPATLTTLTTSLRERGARMAAYATGAGSTPVYWSRWWMMNHLWNNMNGLLAAGLALQPHDAVQGGKLIAVARDRLERAFAALPADGATQESPTYWELTAECVLKYEYIATELFGARPASNWLRRAASYRAAMGLPPGDCSPTRSVINQADGAPAPWFGPEYQLRRLAALNRDPQAQSLAARLEAAKLVYGASPWLNFIWYDPSVSARAAVAPAFRLFDDLGIVVSRTTQTGNENIVVMRAGPPFGKQAQALLYNHDLGLSHVHPDVNHVTLFAKGDFMLRDDGYATRKLTAQHNTLLVNGKGQNYEGGEWSLNTDWPIRGPQPNLHVMLTSGTVDYWVGVGAPAYPTSLGLTRFNRHVLFIKPNILVVIDELAAHAPTEFTLLWHPGANVAYLPTPNQYMVRFTDSSLRASFVMPDGGVSVSRKQAFEVTTGPLTVQEIAVTINAASAQAGALFAWGADGAANQVTLHRQTLTWKVVTPSHVITLIPNSRKLAVASH